MLKALFVNLYKGVGGGEIYFHRLISKLKEESRKIDIYVATPPNKEIVNNLSISNDKIRYIKGLKGNKSLKEFFRFFYSLYQINKILTNDDLDVIVLNGTRAIYMAPFINKKVKKIGIKHMLIEPPFLKIKKCINSFSFHSLDKVVTISKFHLKNFDFIDEINKKISLVYNGIDINEFRKDTSKKNPNNEIVFLEAASLIERKGQLDLIEAFSNLAKKYSNIRLVLAGSGKLKGKIKAKINDYNLESKVEMLGYVENIKKVLQKIDVYVLPSYSEGFPLSILEAMAFSKPIISTRVAGIPEMIRNNQEGFLIEKGDITALEEKMEFFINKEFATQKMGKKARNRVKGKFTEEQMIGKWIDILHSLRE